MTVYYGVVKGNTVILPEDAHVPDGIRVEVHVPEQATERRVLTEEQWLQRLIDSGMISAPSQSKHLPSDAEDTPSKISGKPLSETIIEERR